MWLWRADVQTPFYVTATGRGTTTRHRDSPLQGRAVWQDSVWRVTIARPFTVNLPADIVVPLSPGAQHKCTFAVWQGSNKERAGLKAYQPLWQPLEIER
jgi:DMSO reductase family type II enzyme heme b subunit